MWLQIKEYWQSSVWYDRLFALSLIFFYAFIIIDLWDWAKLGLYLAVLASLIGIFRNGIKPRLTTLEWLILATIIAWLLHTLLSLWLNDMPLHGYDHFKSRQTKWLFFIPIYFYLRQRHVPLWIFWAAVFLCILVTGLDTLWQFHNNNYSFWMRVDGGGQLALRYGAMISTLVMVGILAISKSLHEKRHIMAVLLSLLVLLGLSTIIIAGTRGAWLALVIFALSCLAWLCWRRAKGGQLLLISVLIAAGMTALYQLDFVEERIGIVGNQVADYFSDQPEIAQNAKHTSVGVRFELWKAAWELGGERVWYGRGLGGFNVAVKHEYAQRQWSEHLGIFEYPHNQYLAVWATRGLPGILLLLLFIILPLLFFRQGLHSAHEDLRMIAIAGLILVLSFVIYDLTYDHLEKRVQIAFYAVTLAVLMGMLRQRMLSSSAN